MTNDEKFARQLMQAQEKEEKERESSDAEMARKLSEEEQNTITAQEMNDEEAAHKLDPWAEAEDEWGEVDKAQTAKRGAKEAKKLEAKERQERMIASAKQNEEDAKLARQLSGH